MICFILEILLCIMVFLTIWFLFILKIVVQYIQKDPTPVPPFMHWLVDNPLRRIFWQRPKDMVKFHQIKPGMKVLDIGSGTGTYSLETAKQIGEKGMLYCIDIEQIMISKLLTIIKKKGYENIVAEVGDANNLKYPNEYFDVIYSITVIWEIPDPKKAVKEMHRLLKKGGVLAFSELFFDPDYRRCITLKKMVNEAVPNGFNVKEIIHGCLYWTYTVVFEKK